MSRIRVEVDGDVVFDRDVDEVEGQQSNGHFAMTADWEPEPRTPISFVGDLLGATIDNALTVGAIDPEVLKP